MLTPAVVQISHNSLNLAISEERRSGQVLFRKRKYFSRAVEFPLSHFLFEGEGMQHLTLWLKEVILLNFAPGHSK